MNTDRKHRPKSFRSHYLRKRGLAGPPEAAWPLFEPRA